MLQAATETENPEPSRWKSAWALRAYLSTFGQSLLLYSGLKIANNPSDRHALVGFAGVNLVANAINAIFGGQKKEDKHQLRYLKSLVNDTLAPLADEKTALPSVDDRLTTDHGRKEVESQAHYLLQKYSVTISEFILRTTGSLSLIAPITGWGKAFRNLKNGISLRETFALAKTKNPATFGAGLFSLAGKGFILMASEPDPYNPAPMTLWRSLREKVMFRMSSVSEVITSLWMGHDRFTKQKVTINGVTRPDYAGAAGNSSIILGYIPRWIAPYGTREVNMPELYAHIARGLAALPEEKRADAETKLVSQMVEHFEKKHLSAAHIRHEIEARAKPTPRTQVLTTQAAHEKPALPAERTL